jgi:phosphatidylserine synthase
MIFTITVSDAVQLYLSVVTIEYKVVSIGETGLLFAALPALAGVARLARFN